MADRLQELNDAHGRGIVAELFRDSPPRKRRYRTLSRHMYRDQFGAGLRYAHVIVDWPDMAWRRNLNRGM